MSEVDMGVEQPELLANDASTETDSSPVEVESQEPESAEGGEPQPEKSKPWYQKRIDEITAARREAERRNDQLLALLEQQTRQQQQPLPQSEPTMPTGKPVLENYDSYESYTEALTDWKVEQRFQEREQRQQAETAAQAEARRHDEWMAKVREAQQRAPEIEDAIQTVGPMLSPGAASVIKALPNGPDVVVYLHQHQEEAARIASLDPFMAAAEIGRLAAGIQPAQPRRINQPTPPINTPLAGGTAVTTDPARMTDAQFAAWRKAQIAQRR